MAAVQSLYLNKRKKIALHSSRKVSKYRVIVCVEWALVRGYCGMRSLHTRKQPTLHYLGFVFYFNLVPRTSPLAFEMHWASREPSGKLPIKSFQILLIFVNNK